MCPVAPRIGACSANRQDGSLPFADVGVACDDNRLHHRDRLGGGTATAVGVRDRNRIATRIVHIDGLCGLAGRPLITSTRCGGKRSAYIIANNRIASNGNVDGLVLHHIDGGTARTAVACAGRHGIIARRVDIDRGGCGSCGPLIAVAAGGGEGGVTAGAEGVVACYAWCGKRNDYH